MLLWASLPLDREVPSLKIRIGISDVSNHILMGVRSELPEINIC